MRRLLLAVCLLASACAGGGDEGTKSFASLQEGFLKKFRGGGEAARKSAAREYAPRFLALA
ncbi:MAG: hypothetical protein K2W96_28000, partial [Gemmataceae bacterium]|nr:hypothetical protein [Gemmataceae bacterium]